MSSNGDQLARLMDEMVVLLRAQGEEQWAEWIEADAAAIRDRDGRGVDHFLAAFNAGGSLYDLIFHPRNGNAATEAEGRAATDRLHELIGEAHPMAVDLSREESDAD